jgi:twitching motility two-component system response regulator PilH
MAFLQSIIQWFRPAPPPKPVVFEPLVEGTDRRGKERRTAPPGTRVLLIDDSATIVALLRRMLRQNGYETLEAGDAEKGIELARSERPDLIFLDIVLPGMNGFAALRTLRRDPETKDIPIIMISGNEQATEEFYVHRIGADDFMKKPFSRTEVFARIERLLDENGIPRRVVAVVLGSEPVGANAS